MELRLSGVRLPNDPRLPPLAALELGRKCLPIKPRKGLSFLRLPTDVRAVFTSRALPPGGRSDSFHSFSFRSHLGGRTRSSRPRRLKTCRKLPRFGPELTGDWRMRFIIAPEF